MGGLAADGEEKAMETNRKSWSALRSGRCFLAIVFCLASFAHSQQLPSTKDAAKTVLERHCLGCHGASEMSGLDMRLRETLL